MRKHRRAAVGIGLALVVAATPVVVAAAAPQPVRFSDARLIVEVNSTDGDAGLQVFIDGEAWKEAAIFAPNGGKLVDFRTSGRVDAYGLTELFSESSEPPFEVFPISEFEELFPEGVYTFRGTTIERTPMVGRARVSHDFPDGPVLVALRKATWSPATTS